MKFSKQQKRDRRHKKIRALISGTASMPRVAVYRSNEHIYVQAIDDTVAKTIVAASDMKDIKGTKSERAVLVGKALGEALKKLGVEKALFDRGGFKYHGRVKSVADGVRAAGVTI